MRYLTLLLLFAGQLHAQSIQTSRIDTLVDRLETNDKAFLSISILKDGKTIYQRASGYRSVEDSLPADSATIYRIGSISKMFTATLIYKLSEGDHLNINDPLERYFPEIPAASEISLLDLLTHRSGLYNITSDESYVEYMTKKQSKADMLDRMAGHETVFEPGLKHSYSNTNYILLGYIIEKVTGRSYGDVLNEYITGKLDLEHTHYGDKIEPLKNEAHSYQYLGQWSRMPETDMSIPHGAGAIVSTPTDLTVFIRNLIRGDLIDLTSVTSMTAFEDGYGSGIFESGYGSHVAYGHSGAIDGNVSDLKYFPDDDLAIAVCSNGMAYNIDEITDMITAMCFNEPVTIPEFKTVVLTPEQLESYQGKFSSSDLPLEITIKSENGVLTAQAKGQSAFPLDAQGDHKFRFDAAGIVITFDPSGKSFLLEQGGGKFNYTRD